MPTADPAPRTVQPDARVRERYAIVTPARDEAPYLPDLAESMLAQTLPFARWVIVDDGSSDGTTEIARSLAESDDRIEVLVRSGREHRGTPAEIEAFNLGVGRLGDLAEYAFVGKLDADLVLPPDYFERLAHEFRADPRLGIAGGHCYNRVNGRLVVERVPSEHVRGATKIYRRDCFDEVGPIPVVPGWDTIDEVRAWDKGWRTCSYEEPGVIHQKPTTGGSGRVLHGRFVIGRQAYFLGYQPLYLALRLVKNAAVPPRVFGALALGWGYLSGMLLRLEKFEDASFRRALESYQRERLASLTVWKRPVANAGRSASRD